MKLIIDRVEGELAVLVAADDDTVSFNLPISYLPAGVTAGDHLNVDFTVDKESRAAAARRTRALLDELTRNADPAKKKFKL